jgi:uncharacterized protein with HEPN domain
VAKGRETFDQDRLLQRAAKNVLSEIGEAAKGLSTEVTDAIDEVPWKEVKGIREKIVHDYYAINLDIVWSTFETWLPDLEACVRRWLEGG